MKLPPTPQFTCSSSGSSSCIKILDSAFLETYPLHVQRKQFFEARQKEGQSPLEFHEELLLLIDEADGTNITVNDLICMMLQIGLSDQVLQRELGSIREPTLQSFTEKIEGYEQGLKSTGSATRGPSPRRPTPQNSRTNTSNEMFSLHKGRSHDNKLHLSRFGKVQYVRFNRSYCSNLCPASECPRYLFFFAASTSPVQLAITYDGGSNFPSDGSSTWQLPSSASSVSASTHAGAFYLPSHRPTPEMPL